MAGEVHDVILLHRRQQRQLAHDLPPHERDFDPCNVCQQRTELLHFSAGLRQALRRVGNEQDLEGPVDWPSALSPRQRLTGDDLAAHAELRREKVGAVIGQLPGHGQQLLVQAEVEGTRGSRP